MRRAITAVARFLWEFVVGESPVAFVATLVVLGAAFGLRHHPWAATVVLPLVVVVGLVVGAFRGRRRSA